MEAECRRTQHELREMRLQLQRATQRAVEAEEGRARAEQALVQLQLETPQQQLALPPSTSPSPRRMRLGSSLSPLSPTSAEAVRFAGLEESAVAWLKTLSAVLGCTADDGEALLPGKAICEKVAKLQQQSKEAQATLDNAEAPAPEVCCREEVLHGVNAACLCALAGI